MSQASDQSIPTQGPYYSLRVREVVRETADACSLILEIPPELEHTFRYEAGQFLTFRIPVAGKRLVRCYSLASSPATDRLHKVTVKRIDQGRVSNQVNDEVRAGSVLEVMKPAGHFCLRSRPDEQPIVLFSGGSGITPVISIVKTALATTRRPILLLYANRDADSIIFRGELDELVASHPGRLRVEHSLDDRDGFVDAARARRFAEAHAEADFYVCGPAAFMDVVEEALAGLAVPGERLFIERFESPDDEAPDVQDAGTAASGEGVPVTVLLDGTTTEITCAPGETILQAARRAGLEPPFACEEAYCGCCMAMVKEGEVEMKMNDGGIDPGQIDQGWVLTCQGVPKRPTKIEYPD